MITFALGNFSESRTTHASARSILGQYLFIRVASASPSVSSNGTTTSSFLAGICKIRSTAFRNCRNCQQTSVSTGSHVMGAACSVERTLTAQEWCWSLRSMKAIRGPASRMQCASRTSVSYLPSKPSLTERLPGPTIIPAKSGAKRNGFAFAAFGRASPLRGGLPERCGLGRVNVGIRSLGHWRFAEARGFSGLFATPTCLAAVLRCMPSSRAMHRRDQPRT